MVTLKEICPEGEIKILKLYQIAEQLCASGAFVKRRLFELGLITEAGVLTKTGKVYGSPRTRKCGRAEYWSPKVIPLIDFNGAH